MGSVILFVILVFAFAALFVIGIGLSVLGQLMGGVGNAFRLVKRMLGFETAKSKPAGFAGNGGTRRATEDFGRENTRSSTGKEFKRGEGEYVDFEEVKCK